MLKLLYKVKKKSLIFNENHNWGVGLRVLTEVLNYQFKITNAGHIKVPKN